ncbi:hypothetical protein, partial [Thiolapillus sp.]|uniref:hypothetical protein n=3 Tax=Thiolapillus sp. TaxID=2017437 RepID=UPI003AF55E72
SYSAIKSGLPMPFTSISAGWIFTLMGLLDDGRPLNQGKSQKYRPSSGTEGASFYETWCSECARDEGESCEILAKTFRIDVEDDEYPQEWTYDESGRPICTAFVQRGEAIPTPRCTKTIDMFDHQ